MLDIQYTKEGLRDLNYVVVSVRPTEGSDPIIKGLLLGIRSLTRTDGNNSKGNDSELFVWVYKGKTVFILALKYHFIDSLETCVGEKAKKSQSIRFTKSQDITALAKVYIIQRVLGDQSRTKQNGLIDISTYRCLPGHITAMIGDSDTAKRELWQNNTAEVNSAAANASSTNNSKTTSYTPPTAKTVGTSTIERITEYSAEEAILAMEEKIEKIKAKTYQPPVFKKIPADDIEEGEEKVKVGRQVGYRAAESATKEGSATAEWKDQCRRMAGY